MQKIYALLIALLLAAPLAARPDISELLNGLGDRLGTPADSTSQTLSQIGTALGIIPAKTVDIPYLTGAWKYSSPAVAFKSDNLLKKAGGLAASHKIEKELTPHYSRIGFDALQLTVSADSTFTLAAKGVKLSGIATPDPEAKTLTLTMKLFGKIPAGSLRAYVAAESDKSMTLTFEVDKLLELINKLSTFTGNTTLQGAAKILEQYDGITAGFRLAK